MGERLDARVMYMCLKCDISREDLEASYKTYFTRKYTQKNQQLVNVNWKLYRVSFV